jgi:hypothetical protein
MARDDPPQIVHVFLSSVMFDVTSWDDPAAPAPRQTAS